MHIACMSLLVARQLYRRFFTLPGSAWLRGNMAHRAVHNKPLVFIASTYSFTAFCLSILVAFVTVNADNAFSASHTATGAIAAARDLR